MGNSAKDSSVGTVSRRGFLGSVAATGASVALSGVAAAASDPQSGTAHGAHEPHSIELRVNGELHRLSIEPRVTLLDALREHLSLTGTKKGCDRGQCGACTVLLNGRRINSCLTLAVMHQHDDIRTIEGLESNGVLSPLQQSFVRQDAFQCGFCTPGQLCAATAMLGELDRGEPSHVSADVRDAKTIRASAAEIRERMSGNICRCGAYTNIVSAIVDVLPERSR
jgi:xanthine dehydrogenase YagT iron-sulfur-binding subunit